MSAIRSASSIAVTSIAGQVAGALVGVVGEPARGGDQQVDPALQLGGLPVERHAADHRGDGQAQRLGVGRHARRRPAARARGSGRGRGRAGGAAWARPPARRDSSARPKARVLPEPVWPRPSRSRPARVSGRVAAWIGNGAVKPPAVSARSTGSGRPSSAKDGIPVSGTVHSTSAASRWRGPGRGRRCRGSRGTSGSTAARGAAGRRGVRRARGTASEGGRQTNLRDVARRAQEVAAPRWRRLMITPDEPGRAWRPDEWCGCARYDGLLGRDGRALVIESYASARPSVRRCRRRRCDLLGL